MDVVFEVKGREHTVPERQATILAENLRLLAKNESTDVQLYSLQVDEDWRSGASMLADSIEAALVTPVSSPLVLEGGAADATYCVLRLMVGMESALPPTGTSGLRDALGTPVTLSQLDASPVNRPAALEPEKFLTAPELVELLVVLFALAVLTVIAAGEGIVSWYVIGPVIAALMGMRVATTRVKGRIAWTLASVVWWAIFLIPAALLVLLVGALVVAILA